MISTSIIESLIFFILNLKKLYFLNYYSANIYLFIIIIVSLECFRISFYVFPFPLAVTRLTTVWSAKFQEVPLVSGFGEGCVLKRLEYTTPLCTLSELCSWKSKIHKCICVMCTLNKNLLRASIKDFYSIQWRKIHMRYMYLCQNALKVVLDNL